MTRRRARLGWAVVAGTLACAPVARAAPLPASQRSYRLEVTPSNRIRVDERIRIRRAKAELPPLTRNIWVYPTRYPLRERVADVHVEDSAGRALRHRTRRYGDWVNIDLLQLPADGEISLRYTLIGALHRQGDRAVLEFDPLALHWNLPVTRLAIEVVLPNAPPADAISVVAVVGYGDERYPGKGPRVSGRTIHWSGSAPIEPDDRLEWRLELPRSALSAAPLQPSYARELLHSAPLALILAAAALLAVPLLLFVPAAWLVAFVRAWNAVCVVALGWAVWPSVRYWIYEGRYRGGDAANAVTSIVADVALIALVAAFVAIQDRSLARGRREAFYAQLALPVMLALVTPMAAVNPAYLLAPLPAIPILLCWVRRQVAFHFGVGSYLIVERIAAAGEVDLGALADELRLPRRRLEAILRSTPDLPVVVDFASGRALSSEVAAMRETLQICANCGGATETKGQALLACGYCDREYASSRKAQPSRPVPLLVAALARVLESFAIGLALFAALLALAFILLSILEGDASGLVTLVVPGVLAGVAYGLYRQGARVREGKRYNLLRILLILSAPLIVPLVALIRLRSKLVQLHFGRYPHAQLEKVLGERGQLTFAELAELMQCTESEAIEMARYLCGHQIIPGVFDRVGRRLVHRSRYGTLAAAGACKQCGGILGVIEGRVACHYCGAAQPD